MPDADTRPVGRRQTYLDQMIEAFRFYADLNSRSLPSPDFEEIRSVILRNQEADLATGYDQLLKLCRAMGESYVRGYPGQVARSCHSISHGFFKSWETWPFTRGYQLAVTIGNVYFMGRNIYEVSRESVAQIIAEGFQPDKTVDVHVWLTLDDMTVVDLSIISTLVAGGALPENTSTVLFWREEEESDFRFEPILVDNEFFEKVERSLYLPPIRP